MLKMKVQSSIYMYVWCIGLRKYNLPFVAVVHWSYGIPYVAVGYIGLRQYSHPCTHLRPTYDPCTHLRPMYLFKTHLRPIGFKNSKRTKLCILQSLIENEKALYYYIGILFPIPQHLYMTHINTAQCEHLSCSFFRKCHSLDKFGHA